MATDEKVQEECIPGKPISLFTISSPKVSYKQTCLCIYIMWICLKPLYKVTVVNSEEDTSHSISIYDGDNAEKVADRIHRVTGISGTYITEFGYAVMTIMCIQYLGRKSIILMVSKQNEGNFSETKDKATISTCDTFSVKGDKLCISKEVGGHLYYTIK